MSPGVAGRQRAAPGAAHGPAAHAHWQGLLLVGGTLEALDDELFIPALNLGGLALPELRIGAHMRK